MYQEPIKLSNKKKIEIAILIIAILWGILFIFNYVRYTHSKPLLLAIHAVRDYDDGVVEEYISLGYVYRKYERNAIKGEELVPIWVARKNPEARPDLPVVPTDYEIPEDNYSKEDKHRGLLYYYDSKYELVGAYKCINTERDCNKAFGGYDEYNIINKDPLTRLEEQHTMGNIYDKFGFVDDSIEQDKKYGEDGYARTIYLYQFLMEDRKILAKYADIKDSTYDEDKEKSNGENNRFIVKNMENYKWGLIHIDEDGTITEVLPFEYKSINYDSDTKYYILCKDDVWYVYDLKENKKVSIDSNDIIYDVWRNDNMTYYIKTGRDRIVGSEEFTDYKIYRMNDGREFLNLERVNQIMERGSFVAYLTSQDNILHFIDYAHDEKLKLQLKFSEMNHSTITNPAFKIYRENENVLTLCVYKQRDVIDRSSDCENETINLKYWNN